MSCLIVVVPEEEASSLQITQELLDIGEWQILFSTCCALRTPLAAPHVFNTIAQFNPSLSRVFVVVTSSNADWKGKQCEAVWLRVNL